MAMRSSLVVLALGVGMSCVAAAKGPTFDFQAASDRLFGEVGGGNLAKPDAADWKESCHIHRPQYADDRTMLERVRKHITYVRDGRILELRTDAAVRGEFTEDPRDAAAVSASFWQIVRLPDSNGGKYRVSFEFMQNRDGGLMGGLFWTPHPAVKGDTTPSRQRRFPLTNHTDTDWFPFASDIRVPEGVGAIRLDLRFYSVGFLRIRDFALVKAPPEPPISVWQSCQGVADNTFAIASNQCGYVAWEWKRRDDDAVYSANKFDFRLKVPEGFELLETTFKKSKARVPKPASNSRNQFAAMIATRAPHGTEGWLELEVDYDGQRVAGPIRTKLFSVPEVKVRAPRRYMNGVRCGWTEFTDPEVIRRYARMIHAAGVRLVIPSAAEPFNGKDFSNWREAGFTAVLGHHSFLVNGFRVGPIVGRPESDRFVGFDPKFDLARISVCPSAIYEERPFFMTNTVPWINRTFKGTDGVWANWEPYQYLGQGCACETCQRKFAEYLGVKSLPDDWRTAVASGGRLNGRWHDFRSREHGRLVRTVDKYIRAATGGERSYGFLPGVCYQEMSVGWRDRDAGPEVREIDYAGSLRWIEPWGPYPRWRYAAPYCRIDGAVAVTFDAARDVRRQVDADYPPERRPRLMSFPQGYQCDGIIQPEELALQLDSFFFNGWEASAVYHFPCGYDARYWRAFAEATERAATYEDWVLDGRRCDGEVRVDGLTRVVRTVAYERNGRILVVAINFGDERPVELTVEPKGRGARQVRVDPLTTETLVFD